MDWGRTMQCKKCKRWHGVDLHVWAKEILNSSCFTHRRLERLGHRGDDCRDYRLAGRCEQELLQHAADRQTYLERQGHYDRLSNVETRHQREGRAGRSRR